MSKHDHRYCDHVLKYCRVCDVAYCERCGKEWRVSANQWSYTYNNTWPTYTDSAELRITCH